MSDYWSTPDALIQRAASALAHWMTNRESEIRKEDEATVRECFDKAATGAAGMTLAEYHKRVKLNAANHAMRIDDDGLETYPDPNDIEVAIKQILGR
jgi:hypothetical protein